MQTYEAQAALSGKNKCGAILGLTTIIFLMSFLGASDKINQRMANHASEFAHKQLARDHQVSDVFDGCGHWQDSYQAYHRDVLTGKLPPRYLVYVQVQAGLADQITGLITAFLWAILTDRAFQITTGHQRLPPFEAAFEAPYINWTRPIDPLELTEHLYFDRPGPKNYKDGQVDGSKYSSMYLVNDQSTTFASSDLSLLPDSMAASATTLFVSSNRGRVIQLFDNPHHRQALFDMGLRPDTAFSCLFDFLFTPNRATKNEIAKRTLRLQASGKDSMDVEPLKIGIQIRVGDSVFDANKDTDVTLENYAAFFECAKQIADTRKPSNATKVLWYLLSDSQKLRMLALEHFGTALVVAHTERNQHIACDAYRTCNESNMSAAMVGACADMLSLRYTDYQVIAGGSGFGKIAAWLNRPFHSVYLITRPKESVKCGPHDYAGLEVMAESCAGI